MRRSLSILPLFVIIIGVFGFNTLSVLAEYRYVHLRNLTTCEASFLGMGIITSGVFRSDFFFLPENDANTILEDPSSLSLLSMDMSLDHPSNGSNIIVYGIVDYDSEGVLCFYVQFWESGSFSWWNMADINQDLKVNIFDVVLCVNSYESTPLDPQWDTFCDIAEPYCIVDIFDIVMVCSSYGEEYTP